MMYTENELNDLKIFYANQLLNDTIPFWFPKSFDEEYGGFLFMRDADGTLIDDDKAVWIQCRAIWMLSTLYNTVEKKSEWLDGAKKGFDFVAGPPGSIGVINMEFRAFSHPTERRLHRRGEPRQLS